MPPTMLLNSLEGVRKRVKILGVLYGVGLVAAAAVGLLLATIFIDYTLNLYPMPRLILALAAVVAVLYVLIRWVAKPLMARLSLSDVAGRLEQAFPQFNDRLRSTIDFVRSDVPGSETMKQRVVGEASDLAGKLDLGSAVVAKPAWYSLGAGGASILLAILFALLMPNYASIGIQRLLSPFHSQPWPKRVEIQVAGDLPNRVPVGQRVDVKMKLARGDSSSRKAVIIYRYDNGPEQREYMLRSPDGTYTASIDARVETGQADSKLQISMEAGDDQKSLAPITVVPRLSIRSVEAELTPPPYVTNQKITSVNLIAAPATVAEGGKIAVKVNFTKPLAEGSSVELIPSSEEMAKPDVQWQSQSNTLLVGNWIARKSLRFHLRATDVDGFHNNALEEYELIVRPDQNPSVQIESPRRNEERTPDSVVPLVGLAEDDFGISSLKLMVDRVSGGPNAHWEIPLLKDNDPVAPATAAAAEGSTDRIRLRVNYNWALAQLKDANLKSNEVLEYYLAVKDNFALDGQTHAEVPSGRLRITIITPEDLIARVTDDLRQIKQQIQSVKTTQDQTRAETTDVANDTRNRNQLDAADRAALERLTNQQATSTSQTKQIASRVNALQQRLNENGIKTQELTDIARDVTADLERAAENPMREATNQLSTANRQNTAQSQRNPSAQNPQPENNDEQGQPMANADQQQQNQNAQQNQQNNGAANRPNNGAQQQQRNATASRQQSGQQNQNQQQQNQDQQQASAQQQDQQRPGRLSDQATQNQQANANAQRSSQQKQSGQRDSTTQPQDQTAQSQQSQQQGDQQANADQQQQGQQNQDQQNQQGQQQSGNRSQQANASAQRSQQRSGQQSGQQRSGQQQSGQQQASNPQSGQQQSGQQQPGQQQSGQQQASNQQQQGQQSQQGQQGQQGQQQQQQPQTAEAQQRAQALAQAMQNQQQASEELQRAMDRMNNIGSLQETLSKLRDLLQQQQQLTRDTRQAGQQNIGRTPEQMSQQDRDRMNQLAEQQQRMAEQTNQAMQQMQQQSQQMRQSDPTASQAMQRAQQSGQQQQTAQNQQRAAGEMRNNQQADAQQAQRQAELGLQTMVDQLHEAEQHRLAELQKQLEEMQQQIANLIRRQAGHNLDNLLAQGADKIPALDEQTRSDLLLKAERVMENLGQAQSPSQLSTAQEQTERNTRDLSKTAEQTTNGAESASHLTRAADRMERAIVNLRDKKLTDAYDPSQIEALSELDAAMKTVDQQREQVDQQVDDQKKETLRQRYVKVRAEQQKLNEETAQIDKSRAADGSLGRADAVRVGQMPGEQGKVSDEVKAIGEDLATGDATVYTWANKDIAESMDEVKDSLGKQETGVATQSEQTRIADQLDAMIRNLAVKPRESRFAQDAQDQQQRERQQPTSRPQQNRGPRLPAEAQLRLLQDLQRAVNKNTIVLNDLPDKDKSKLLNLGTRQGDLRGVLDQMLQNASQGKIKLGPEPDNKDQLPEEAKAEDIENQELEQDLLKGVPDDEKGDKQANLIGDRMARSRQRLALNDDPGKVTQEIQQRIIIDLDGLIQQAREQEAQTRNSQQRQRQQRQQQQQDLARQNAQRMQQAQQNRQQPQNQDQRQQDNPNSQSAIASRVPGQAPVNQDLSKQIPDSAAEWGAISPRLREAAVDGAGEQPIEQYRKMYEDYTRRISTEGAAGGQ